MVALSGHWRTALAVAVWFSVTGVGVTAAIGLSANPKAAPLSPLYSLDFSQISSGASQSGSANYQAEEVISVACAKQPVQSGSAYSISNVVGEEAKKGSLGAAWILY